MGEKKKKHLNVPCLVCVLAYSDGEEEIFWHVLHARCFSGKT